MTILTDRTAVAPHIETRPTIGSSRRDPKVAQAMQRFLNAHAAAEEACTGLTRAQASGPDPLPRNAAYLIESANLAWQELLVLAGEDRDWVHDQAERRLGEVTMREYQGRRRRSGHVVQPTFGSWQESVGNMDWSRGRGAA